MKINVNLSAPTCECLNQYLLAPGSLCEICMGLVPETTASQVEKKEDSTFDANYFEALESYLDSIEEPAIRDNRRAA